MRQREDNLCSYTAETFTYSQMEKIIEQKKNLQLQQAELDQLKNETQMSCIKPPDCLRIVLIGKTGCGKSASGNTILGRNEFKARLSQYSVTHHCQKAQGQVIGHPVIIVDTPGLLYTNLSDEVVNDELVKCMSLLAPGPHVFLLVMQIGRFTEDDKWTLKQIKKVFGKRSEKFTIVLFTGGDDLEKIMTVEKCIESSDPRKKLISDCGGRYHVINNNNDQNRSQVRDLIRKINNMVKNNGGSFYSNEMLQEAEAATEKEMKRILKEKEEMERMKEKTELNYMSKWKQRFNQQ